MFKLLLFILLFYLVFRYLGNIIKILSGKDRGKQQFTNNEANYRESDNVHIDYIPKSGNNKTKKEFKGGEYIDYEEVK